jgi:hypothetical protein
MVIFPMVAASVTQIGMVDGVLSIGHREVVHAIVEMETVEWVQLVLTIIVYAIQGSPVQTVILKYASQGSPVQTVILKYAQVDVRINYVRLSIIEHNVTIMLHPLVILCIVNTINIAKWSVQSQDVHVTSATLVQIAMFQPYVRPKSVGPI